MGSRSKPAEDESEIDTGSASRITGWIGRVYRCEK